MGYAVEVVPLANHMVESAYREKNAVQKEMPYIQNTQCQRDTKMDGNLLINREELSVTPAFQRP